MRPLASALAALIALVQADRVWASDPFIDLIWRHCPTTSDGLTAVRGALTQAGWTEQPAPPPMPRLTGADGEMYVSPAGDAIFALYRGNSVLPPLLGKVYACYAIPTAPHLVAAERAQAALGFAPTVDAEGISRWFFVDERSSRLPITGDMPKDKLSSAMGEGRYGLFELLPASGTTIVSLYRPAK